MCDLSLLVQMLRVVGFFLNLTMHRSLFCHEAQQMLQLMDLAPNIFYLNYLLGSVGTSLGQCFSVHVLEYHCTAHFSVFPPLIYLAQLISSLTRPS